MDTVESMREKIRKNMPKGKGGEVKPLTWNRVAANKIVSGCGKYCIQRAVESDRKTFDAWRCNSKSDYGVLLAEKIKDSEEAKAVCDADLKASS